MSERVINDPTVAGWELDSNTGYWMWAAGGGGSIQDGDTEGQITTWDGTEWTPEGAVVVEVNDTTISTARLNVGSSENSQIQFMRDTSNYLDFRGKLIMRHRYAADGGPNTAIMEIDADTGSVNIIGKLLVNGVEVGGGGLWTDNGDGSISYNGTVRATDVVATG